jgi:hypothetical protein
MSLFVFARTSEFEIINPLFRTGVNVDNTYTDNQDIGFFGQYYDGTNVCYTGLFRDASDAGRFKLFNGLQALPVVDDGSALVNTAGTGYALASLDVKDLRAFGDATIDGDLIVNGTTTTINSTTLTVEDNIIIANSGPLNQLEDAGFVVRRIPANIIGDTAKQSGTASAAGTTTTITLEASNGHGTTLDYYTGWVVSFGGDVTGTAIVASSTAADPPVLTFSPAASGSTTTSTTYSLYNKQYAGWIYDESTDYATFYGFPREDTEAIIDPLGDSGNGNLADYVNVRVGTLETKDDLLVSGDATITGSLTVGSINTPRIDDNILVVNSGPLVIAEDFGYVGQRTATRVGADTPKLDLVAVQTNYTANSTTLLITEAATGANYYEGWVVGNSVNSEFRTITASTESSGTHTLTLDSGFTAGLTAGTDTVRLYNKRYVGTIYDESTDTLMAVGFPREDGETKIDPVSPVNGNVPDYVNFAVNNLTVAGSFNFSGSIVNNTKTQVSAVTFTSADIFNYAMILLNPTGGNTTYTLPLLSSLSLVANTAYIVIFSNIHASNNAVITRSGSDTIEGKTSLNLNKQYLKTVLCAVASVPGVWLVKG